MICLLFFQHQRFGNKKSYNRPSRISSSMPSLPVDDVIHSNSTPNIYGKALASGKPFNFSYYL